MKKNTYFLSLFVLMILSTTLQARERTESVAILGGGGFYEYSSGPDMYGIFFFQLYNTDYGLSTSGQVLTPLHSLAEMELYQTQKWKGSGSIGKIQYERLLLDSKSLGLTAGITHSVYEEKCISGCQGFPQLYFLQTAVFAQSPYAFAFGSYFLGEPKLSYQMTTLDVGLNYHVAPAAAVDPYVGAGVGLGVCYVFQSEAGAMCTGSRVGLRLGARVNVHERVFFIFQGEVDRVRLSVYFPSAGSGSAELPTTDKHILGGVGLIF